MTWADATKCEATWADQIDGAMRGYTADDVLFWLRNGEAMMFISGDLHASIKVGTDGTAQVAHMAGTWTDSDAAWIIERARARMREIGIPDLQINGRPGWKRFLQMKGIL